MADLRIAIAASLAILATGCATSSSNQAGQVQEVAPGTYSIGISRGATSALLSSSAGEAAIGDAVAQAGAYCHAKGQKYVHQTAAKGQITFKCVPNPQ